MKHLLSQAKGGDCWKQQYQPIAAPSPFRSATEAWKEHRLSPNRPHTRNDNLADLRWAKHQQFSTRPRNRESKHGHTDHQDVIELLDSINFRQQLVYNGIVDSSATRHASSLLADCINLIKNDDMHTAVCSELSERKNTSGMPHVITESNPNKTVTSQQAQPRRYRTSIPPSVFRIACYVRIGRLSRITPSPAPKGGRLVGFAQTQDLRADSGESRTVSGMVQGLNKKSTRPKWERAAQTKGRSTRDVGKALCKGDGEQSPSVGGGTRCGKYPRLY